MHVRPEAIDLPALQKAEGEGLLAALIAQRARLALAGEKAQEFGNLTDTCRIEAGVIANLRLTAELLGQLTTHHQVTHASVLVSPDYIRLRQAITAALRSHPLAARDVAAALARLEADAAREITASANGKVPVLIEHRAEDAVARDDRVAEEIEP